MAGEWHVERVSDLQRKGVLLVEDGNHGEYRPRPDEFVESGIAFIRAADMDSGRVLFNSASRINETARRRITKGIGAPGDVLLSHKGTVGKVALVPADAPPFVCSPQTTLWRTLDAERLDRTFLHAFLRSPRFTSQLTARSGETDMAPYVSLTAQRSLTVSLPPIDQQVAIGHILGTLDDKIELNRRTSETLEAMARALFKSWFVDFDPVRAKAQGLDTGLPRDVADLFPASFEPSELGDVPKGWTVVALSDLAGLNPETWSKESRPAVIHYVDLASTKWGRIEGVTTYAAREAPSRAQRVLRHLDTIIGTVRPGNGSYALIAPEGLTGSTGFAVLRPAAPEHAELVYLAATAPESIQALAHLADGAAYPAVRPEVVAAIRVVRPRTEVLRAFSRTAGPILSRVAACETESRALAGLCDALLPKLISGELRIEDLERFRAARE